MTLTEMWTWILFGAVVAAMGLLFWVWAARDPRSDIQQVEREAVEQLRVANRARLEGIHTAIVAMQQARFDLHRPVGDPPEPVTASQPPTDPGIDQIRTVRLARAADAAATHTNGAEYRGLHWGAES